MAQKLEDQVDKNPRAMGTILVMAMFACLGLVDVMAGKYVEASLWLSLASALAALGPESTPWPKIPKWRQLTGLFLLALSVALFALQIGRDLAS